MKGALGTAPLTLAGKRVCVAVPDTVLEEQESTREKTIKLGQIARYCALFGVDTVRVFNDPRGRGESGFIKKVLEYLETPQYLRKRLFPLSEDLRYAGLLPPLRIPSHKAKVPLGRLHEGEVREAVVLQDGLSADAGLDAPVALRRKETPNKRVTVKVTSVSPSGVEAAQVERREAKAYWGYSVEVSGIPAMLADPAFPLKVATSRLGDPIANVARSLRIDLQGSSAAMILFGSPSRGLFETIGKDLRSRVGYVVNLFAEQNVVTVRSEEAILSALYLVGLLASPDLPPFV
ncbi:MAG TPA: RNA methyltransferase [Nitrososphaerales archaeon]|nr:RNA methyltransferase [Nitrososphaerales archaeon]